ncbi:hypothetical protein [Bacillus sp. Marseille-Q3570]|uniref:hypothetical protein n=1 Tax=Bacillus sp. Marseille-Q3570 TaxID=2963522 RepID=UPI0021B74EBA|nr:hypothetical protein [Bacillus sp. Marseille-Q3570]
MNGRMELSYGQTDRILLFEWSYGAFIRINKPDVALRMVVWSFSYEVYTLIYIYMKKRKQNRVLLGLSLLVNFPVTYVTC